MLNDYKMRISYINSDKIYASAKDKTGHYVIDVNESEQKLSFVLRPTIKMRDIKFSLTYEYAFPENAKVFPNGYQSWTDSRELGATDIMPPLTEFAAMTAKFSKCKAYGDYNFANYLTDKGFFHAFSYGYIRDENQYTLIGSLNERSGYTLIYFNMAKGEITIEKELHGVELDNGASYEVMNLFCATGEYNAVFDQYFRELGVKKPKNTHKCGYTSWYNYFDKIDETIINRDLESIATAPQKLDIFQIDDGYQSAVGDWLSVDPVKFPNGLKPIVENIHSKDMLAGLWLAPFSVVRKSNIFKQHKDWLIKGANGIVSAGANWGGFYTLDIYNANVQEYLKGVFDTVLNEWGFDMVKLDFLYSVCVVPYNGKSRGEIMCDAMDMLREWCGDKLILGCGVPLWSAFGKVDFCRTGSDVALNWKRKGYFERYHREGVGTETSLMNTIFRRHLDGRAFVNDPDVYLLRNENNELNIEQKSIIAKINKIFGNLLFISDNIAEYNEEQLAIFNDTIAPCDKVVLDAKYVTASNVQVNYIENKVEKQFTFDIQNGKLIDGTL